MQDTVLQTRGILCSKHAGCCETFKHRKKKSSLAFRATSQVFGLQYHARKTIWYLFYKITAAKNKGKISVWDILILHGY